MNSPESVVSPTEQIVLGVITARQAVSGNRWIDERWTVLGAIAGSTAVGPAGRRLLRSAPDGDQYLWPGLSLRLVPSEADAYYYNLTGASPRLYVYCHRDDDGAPVPDAITLDYIEAMAHGEFGNEVFSIPIPPEIYRQIEQYVLANFVPEEPRKRRKPDGAGGGEGGRDVGCG